MELNTTFLRYLIKRGLVFVIPITLLLTVSLITGDTACDDIGADPMGSGGLAFFDPCE